MNGVANADSDDEANAVAVFPKRALKRSVRVSLLKASTALTASLTTTSWTYVPGLPSTVTRTSLSIGSKGTGDDEEVARESFLGVASTPLTVKAPSPFDSLSILARLRLFPLP